MIPKDKRKEIYKYLFKGALRMRSLLSPDSMLRAHTRGLPHLQQSARLVLCLRHLAACIGAKADGGIVYPCVAHVCVCVCIDDLRMGSQ